MSTSPAIWPSRSPSSSAARRFLLNRGPRFGGAYRNLRQPLPKPVACMHNSRPARRAALRSGGPGGARIETRIHAVLTDSEVAVRCAARFNERPSGRPLKPAKTNPHRGVDERQNRAKMGGSLRRKLRSIEKQALRPLPQIFDSVRRILMRTSGWWCESISRRSRKSKKDSTACKCWRVVRVPDKTTALEALDVTSVMSKILSEEFDPGSE